MPNIEVDHVTKEYRLGQPVGAASAAKHPRGTYVEQHKPFTALDDVRFPVESGEVLGIVGCHGTGKSAPP